MREEMMDYRQPKKRKPLDDSNNVIEEKHEDEEDQGQFEADHSSQVTQPVDSPIDLSQLSTRSRRPVDLTSRSASESCLASSSQVGGSSKKRRTERLLLPPPPLLEHRSVSHADLAGYRAPWLGADLVMAPSQSRQNTTTPSVPPNRTERDLAETLKFRCMSDSGLNPPAGSFYTNNLQHHHQQQQQFQQQHHHHPRQPEQSNSRHHQSADADFYLRRTISETVLPSNRSNYSGTGGGSGQHSSLAMEMFKRTQQQVLLQHQQGELGADAGSSSSSTSSFYLPAVHWLYNLQLIQSLQAAQQQQTLAAVNNPVTGSGRDISAGSSPTVAPSASGSDGEGGELEEDLEEPSEEGQAGFQLKRRSPRALTGKHVRVGTGASPATLAALKHKVLRNGLKKGVGVPNVGGSSGKKNVSAKLKCRMK